MNESTDRGETIKSRDQRFREDENVEEQTAIQV